MTHAASLIPADLAQRLAPLLEAPLRVVLPGACASTQDVARTEALALLDSTLADAAPVPTPVLVVTDQQTSGRGRLGRRWEPTQGLGLAVTLAMPDTPSISSGAWSIAAGLAALHACERALLRTGVRAPLAVRWPNDVVLRDPATGGPAGKLAGVLVERADGLTLVGVGVNVLHEPTDFPEEIRATSLVQIARQHQGETPRLHEAQVITSLLADLVSQTRALAQDHRWRQVRFERADCLRGRRATFSGRSDEGQDVTVRGRVAEIDPEGIITIVREEDRRPVRLPSATASLDRGSIE